MRKLRLDCKYMFTQARNVCSCSGRWLTGDYHLQVGLQAGKEALVNGNGYEMPQRSPSQELFENLCQLLNAAGDWVTSGLGTDTLPIEVLSKAHCQDS